MVGVGVAAHARPPSCRMPIPGSQHSARSTGRQAMRGFFHRQGKFQPILIDDERPDQQIPEDLWVKCPKCNDLIYTKELLDNNRVCPKCSHHFRMRARERIAFLADPDTFEEWDASLRPEDPLQFSDGSGPYPDKLRKTQKKSGEPEALVTGR